MAKSKPAAGSKGQTKVTSFFTGGKKTVKSDDEVDDAPQVEEEAEAEVVVDKKAAPGMSTLPPINSIPAIFKDLVGHVPEIKAVAEQVEGRKLRVATMCSGTESPLLALELIQDSIQELYGKKLDVQHVFSCEIEPFKQAYIERNFSPPILFRDICELGGDEATTAYGSLARVPGDVDLLIAGTSCVDYSNLNNEKQDIDANGESGRTFRGMMAWVTKNKPPLVILENVCGAPWDKVANYFEKKGYSAAFLRVDTKGYYIPHTRTRVYLLAVNQKNSKLPDIWKKMIGKLQRPASTTLDEWLLPSDDPRIHQARQKLVQESYGALDRRTGRTDWGRCESRHQRTRLEFELGPKRPLTGWEEGGHCKLPDFAWGDWGVGQVERVWDLMDISLLRSAQKGVDPSFKTQVWNLSQNVDREIGSKRIGICPCLTPSMIPYITNRGGPMVGLEALSMQGLPVDKLLLTRETEDQLADLAGNAMSTTVVGACMLAALVVGKKLLKHGDDHDTYAEKAGKAVPAAVDDDDVMEVDEKVVTKEDMESHVSGETQLVQKPMDLSTVTEHSLPELLAKATSSSRLCECEGRTDMTSRVLNRCEDCDSTSCIKCGGRPEHNFKAIDFEAHPRLSPSAFSRELKSALPMSVSILNVTPALLDDLKGNSFVDIPEKKWTAWRSAVLRAVSMEQRFVELKRQEIWVACFASPVGYLELSLHPQQPEWRFFAKAEDKEPANSDVRRLLNAPIGRLVCDGSLLNGVWEWALPKATTIEIQIKGIGEPIPAWEARLGLLGDYKDMIVYPKIQVTVPRTEVCHLDRDISGVYELLHKCGTANSALHRKIDGDDQSLPTLFLFLDPTRCGDPEDDSFVFSTSKRRLQFGETRPTISKLESKWRQSRVNDTDKAVDCHIPCVWVKSEIVQLQPSKSQNATFSVPGDTLSMTATTEDCGSANALLVCKVPLGDQAGPEWSRGQWTEVDKVHERVTFRALAWLIERIKNINDNFDSWQDMELPHNFCECPRCAPSAPRIRWARTDKKIRAIEDTAQAGAYERALKNRPTPFVTQLKLDDESGVGTVRIGVNMPSLVHRAFSRLPTLNRNEKPQLSWRLNTDFVDPAKLHLPKFTLTSNRNDPENEQPPHFKIPLRPEQARSLGWMLKQESLDAAPFIEEEIAEAILEPLGWRAQGRAQRPVRVRGGVLADEVGYGKTAITLGLIDGAAKSVRKEPKPPTDILRGKIYAKGTLVVVPPHLTRQWGSEIKKFCGNHFEVVIISTAANINPLTVEDIQDADIVVVASNLFHSSVYLANLEAFAAGGTLPAQDGRYFNARLDHVLGTLRHQVDRLRNEGGKAAFDAILEARKKDDEADTFVQKKRLKGARAIAAAEAAEAAAKPVNDTPIPPPSGMKVEVVIPMRTDRYATDTSSQATLSETETDVVPPTSTAASEVEDEEDEDEDEDDIAKPRLRHRPRQSYVISDDDDDADGGEEKETKVSKKPKANGNKRGNKAPSRKVKKSKAKSDASSDYEESNSEDDDFDDSDIAVDESEEEIVQPTKPKYKVKPSTKKAKPASSDVEMDVEEEVPAKKTAPKKRKSGAADDEKPAKKQKLREETDPWKLKSKKVADDWTQMQAPPLEMFHFARLVIDEYTYLDGKILSLVTKLTATRRWVLSGTPPIHDFAALKTIAAFLDIHLGVDDDGEGHSAQVKKRRREQTDVEKFHSFREVRSLQWHAHRHELGQSFLAQFVRQNIAEIDEIPSREEIVPIDLPAAERAIYLELEHHLRALDMTIKRGRKNESDREKRLAKALGDSNSAEEALLKRCSHFDLDVTNEENAMKACQVIVMERTKQLEECKQELVKKLKEAQKKHKEIGKIGEDNYFQEFNEVTREEGVGDDEAREIILSLFEEAGVDPPPKTKKANKGKGKDPEVPTKIKDLLWALREQTHDLRRLVKELVGRVRSKRYFTVVRDLQRQAVEPPTISCPTCKRDSVPIEEVAVLSSCGHTGCLTCVTKCAESEECVYAESGTCKAAARVLNIVKGDTLGVDDLARDGTGRHFGMKLERVIDLIKKQIPKDERILVFVQFPDLMKKVAEAFTEHKVKFLEIKGSASQKSKNLEKYQNDSEERVLLLTVTDESASGANLTSANHAIFLSPLLTQSKEIYIACETQAIGRLRRYGQTKLVHIWRFLTRSTIDMEIFEQRTGRKLA